MTTNLIKRTAPKGRLKWDPNKVHQELDQMERTCAQFRPIAAAIKLQADKLRAMKNLPGYVTQRVDTLILDIKHLNDRAYGRIDSVRENLPQVERVTRRKHLPALIAGKSYRVVMGGALMRAVEKRVWGQNPDGTERANYYERTLHLHVDDVITYLGVKRVRETMAAGDAFKIGETEGLFQPLTPTGRADRIYLERMDDPAA